jgi:hypothetical protein
MEAGLRVSEISAPKFISITVAFIDFNKRHYRIFTLDRRGNYTNSVFYGQIRHEK